MLWGQGKKGNTTMLDTGTSRYHNLREKKNVMHGVNQLTKVTAFTHPAPIQVAAPQTPCENKE